jgi:hypothetical protein
MEHNILSAPRRANKRDAEKTKNPAERRFGDLTRMENGEPWSMKTLKQPGLRVTTAWTIATQTESALKEGNYVQGTVLLVLRKQIANATAFLDEIYPQVEHEVKAQFDTMLALEDQEDPNFGDTDYQLAAYAAAPRVLTQYKSIEEIDVSYELAKTRKKGEVSPNRGDYRQCREHCL